MLPYVFGSLVQIKAYVGDLVIAGQMKVPNGLGKLLLGFLFHKNHRSHYSKRLSKVNIATFAAIDNPVEKGYNY